MKTVIIGVCSLFFVTSLGVAYAAGIPNHDHPTTFLGPTVKARYTAPISDLTAYSLAGEAGIKNFRVGGTLAFRLTEEQRLKLSADYLWQKITYPFFSGNIDRWMDQASIGAFYQYDFLNTNYYPQFDLQGYLSHAPSKNLSTVKGIYINQLGISESYVDQRRIAGSNAGGISPGLTIEPWGNGKVGFDVNYDNVRYTKNTRPSQDSIGFGGTLRLKQALNDHLELGLSAGIRKPFNVYQASLSSNNYQYYGRWNIGLDSDYMVGKNALPDTYDVAVSVNYFMEDNAPHNNLGSFKGYKDAPPADPDDFLDWTADPAVYLPQVLAVSDGLVAVACTPITLVSPIAAINDTAAGISTFAIAGHFTSTNIIFSLSATPPVGSTVTINPTTGVITVNNTVAGIPVTFPVTITASNSCNTVSTTFNMTLGIVI